MTKRTKRLLAMMSAKPKLRKISGLPPLTYTAKEGTLKNYRIYGQTVDGESVGDRTGNLFDGIFLQGYYAGADGSYVANYPTWICTNKLPCKPNATYTLSFNSVNSRWYGFFWFTENGDYILSDTVHSPQTQCHYTASSPSNAAYMAIDIAGYPDIEAHIKPSDVTDLMLVEGSTPLPYEPYGYKVPVTVEGKNLLQNTATSQTINGVTFTVNSDGSVTCNTDENGATGAAVFIVKKPIYLDSTTQCILAGCPNGGRANTYRIQYADSVSRAISDYGSSITFFPFDASAYPEQNIAIVISENTVCNNLTFYPMIRKADITDDTYEPYHAPVTTPIYLPEQIRKVGDEAEYIDYSEQKQYFADGTSADVTLPALPTLTGTNVLSVGTEVQPSLVEIEGRIKPVVTGGGE